MPVRLFAVVFALEKGGHLGDQLANILYLVADIVGQAAARTGGMFIRLINGDLPVLNVPYCLDCSGITRCGHAIDYNLHTNTLILSIVFY